MIAEIHVRVSFEKHTLTKKDLGVVQGDYNTTKLVFDFEEDVSGHEIVFKMSDPQGNVILLSSITNNEVILVGYTEDGVVSSLFEESGLYPFELVAKTDDSKLTSAPGWLNVNKRQVPLTDITFSGYYPYLEDLENQLDTLTSELAKVVDVRATAEA